METRTDRAVDLVLVRGTLMSIDTRLDDPLASARELRGRLFQSNGWDALGAIERI